MNRKLALEISTELNTQHKAKKRKSVICIVHDMPNKTGHNAGYMSADNYTGHRSRAAVMKVLNYYRNRDLYAYLEVNGSRVDDQDITTRILTAQPK